MTALRIALALVLLLSVQSTVKAFDYFYFVVQWPGSYCNTKEGCCYPPTGKPKADFFIHGLQAANSDGTTPQNCNPNDLFNEALIKSLKSDLLVHWPSLECPKPDAPTYWGNVWSKRGTCSTSVLDQYNYFETSLNLLKRLDLLGELKKAGIKPDGGFYNKTRISKAVKRATGTEVGIDCNADESNNDQLYQLYICVDKTGTDFIDCPALPAWLPSSCASNAIEFPVF